MNVASLKKLPELFHLHDILEKENHSDENRGSGGAWVAQSVKRPISAQVMISTFMSLSPVLGSVLKAQSLEPALDSVSLSFSAPPLLTLAL